MSEVNQQTVDPLFADFSGDRPGAAVMVIKDGTAVLSKGYGLANLDSKIPCTPGSNFRLASVTKQFTAMSILILSERGKLSFDDKMMKFLPEFPDYGKDITIRQLLTHTSGLPDYEDFMPAGLTIPLSDRDVLHILRQQTKGRFTPGTQFNYSNSGYACLALIVEVASGQTFPAFLKDNLFVPLGMANSVAYVSGLSTVPNRAFGYAKVGEKFEFSDQSLTSAVLGDGGIYSSLNDLFKWDQALYTDKLVSKQMLNDAFTIHSKTSDFEGSGYGYGWYIGKNKGTQHVWHYGSTCGFRTQITRYPEKKLSIIILTNRREADLAPIVEKLREMSW